MRNILHALILLSLLLLQSCSINEPISNNLITALSKIDDIESIASEYDQGLILKSISCKEVEYNGQAEKWIYKYSSGGIAVDYYFHATEREVKFDSTSIITLDGEGLIVDEYFNSDDAMMITENSGGREFRKNNLDYTIEITLVEPLIQDPEAMWFVKYKSSKNNNILHIGINNSTQEVGLYY